MTDLEKRVEEYLNNNHCKNVCTSQENEECVNGVRVRCMSFNIKRKHLIEFTQQETKLLSQHILNLQADKGRLTDELKNAMNNNVKWGAELADAKEIIRDFYESVKGNGTTCVNTGTKFINVLELMKKAEAFINKE